MAEAALSFLQTDPEPVAPGCKGCKDRPTCTCMYNGQPRVSCTPCCYQSNFTGQMICRD